ncbi:polyketide-type polyunsaturated fatty acid synthase PfaA [Tahibacter aquaticus]|uniref:Polyketide-type polyunsaturated fatty acid synthase PfaA n=1 Tax=Tahibacter aquaticus TaxID=520092 RepID=A0A4R6YUE3_9GAMM|nr:type I polyketide synthase [Tahibacter aquaticus]TDR42093.1 polyketide-type polyunsaturated fatty acid synthase PfaA [Tahibacter aquaticus]
MSSLQRQPIAIVGVSAIFPGSHDANGFWRDILAGKDLLTDVPATHWRIDDYYDADPAAPDKTYARRGGFLAPMDFDALGWGIPPSTIPATDTSQLLALIAARAVLEDAAREQFETMDRSRISVILGVTSAQELLFSLVSRLQRPVWQKALRETGLPEDEVQAACERIAAHYVPWQEASFPGLLGNVVAGRIANRLGLGGTNCVTDAACASSFSAIQMAVNELQLGDSDLVISGGVDTLNDIFMYMCFSKTPALSTSGDCRPFSDQADGTMLGEGLGMVALKRLSDAERDGDRVYAVLRGVGTSSDGRAKSVYAPVSAGQAVALRRAYAQAGFGPDTVELVEAHGTGTKAGDAAEFEGLRSVYADADATRTQWCALGSVKSQIGHTKAAAGAAGLFKAVMALHHKVLPPTIKADTPNTKLDLPQSPFYLNTSARPWIRDASHPRRAAVSAFGFGGSNFHLALEEYVGPAPRAERLATQSHELIALSAASADAMIERIAQLRQSCAGTIPLSSLARASRDAFDHSAALRLAVVAASATDLDARLTLAHNKIAAAPALAFQLPDGTSYGVGAPDGALALLFPGQGSQYHRMGAAVAMQFDAARAVWDRAAGLRIHEIVFGSSGDALTRTENAQPALGLASMALLNLLRELGVEGTMAAGHSFGEIVALHAAGVIAEADVLRIARRRGELMRDAAASGSGAMCALACSIEKARTLMGPSLAIANHNAPEQVVVSGPLEAIAALEAQGVAAKRLPVSAAFHSAQVAPACAPFGEFLAAIEFAAPRMPVYANTHAAPYSADVVAVLARQIAEPVRFVETIEAMYAAGARCFVEVGPGTVLKGLVGAILGTREHRAIALDRKGTSDLEPLLAGIAQLVAAGHVTQVSALFADVRVQAPRASHKHGIAISGSNVGKPYPPADPSQLPAPNPARSTPPRAESAPVVEVRTVKEESSLSPAWLATFQEVQQQTANAHAAHQRALSDSHTQYLKLAESALNGLTALLGGTAPTAVTTSVTTAAAPIAAPQIVAPQIAAPLPVVTAAPAPVAPPAPVMLAAPAAVPAPMPAPGSDLAALLLAIVADKTGYPAEMINLDMDLEADLGVDSIKRVEILAALHTQGPAIAQTDSTTMAGLHTLRQIAGYLQGVAVASAPVASTPVAPTAAADDIAKMLLGVVADKTGYPVEMLDLAMDIEADLGIDSIKRVEILAAMTERVPGIAKDRAVPSALHTLADIVAYLGVTPAAMVPVPDAPTAKPMRRAELGRFVLELIPAPAAGFAAPGLLDGEPVYVFGAAGLDTAVATALRSDGVDARAVDALPDGAKRCVYLGGLRRVEDEAQAMAVNREAFVAAQRLASVDDALFVTVQDTGGHFGVRNADARRAWLAGLPALVKTAALEWPRATLKSIDVERGARDDVALAEAIAGELLRGGGEIEVALPAAGGRYTLKSVARAVRPSLAAIDAGDVVVVSGGARGVTAACMVEWARQCKARFVLIGRTPLRDEPADCAGVVDEAPLKRIVLARGASLTPNELSREVDRIRGAREIRATLAAIEAQGAQARYESVAIDDAAALAATLERVRQDWGAIAGVVHAAGVLADRRIADKTLAQFDLVFGTKVGGLRALLAATAADPLKLLCVFSSVSARCGNTGQSDYAMANEVLAKVVAAEARKRPGLRAKSLGWGPWEGGMVTPALKARFAELGVPMIPLDAGATMFADEMRDSRTADIELVLGGEPRGEALLMDGAQERVQGVELIVSRASHAFLEGHAVKGTPVVPVVLVAEWLARAARSFRPGLALASLHELKVLKGIRLGGFDNGGDRCRIEATPLPSARGAQLLMTVRDARGVLNYSARAELLPEPPKARRETPGLSLDTWSGESIYPELLFHRKQFELIDEVHGISDEGIGATVRGVDAAGWDSEPWSLDVAALDGGLQIAALHGRRMLGGQTLPTAIAELRHFGAEPITGPVTATAYLRKVGTSDTTTDIVLTDKNGKRYAEMLGVQNHALPN